MLPRRALPAGRLDRAHRSTCPFEKRLFLVMELVEGKDLDDLMATGLLPFPVVIYVVCEMLRGLGYAHNLPAGDGGPRGIIHRDVSPHNVLLSWEGAVKVSDFGIAKARSASNATASVFIKGKPAYMSPEQANGTNLDGRSDLFAAGIMLWELLVGHRLFVGGTTQETLAKVLFLQVPWPRQHRAGVPEDVERVAMRLLERDPNHRYHSAEDAIADLLQCALAPKSGRDELMNAMAERFPQQAPVRTVRRSIPPGATPRAVSDGASAPVALPYGGRRQRRGAGAVRRRRQRVDAVSRPGRRRRRHLAVRQRRQRAVGGAGRRARPADAPSRRRPRRCPARRWRAAAHTRPPSSACASPPRSAR
jgi:hypothetical protein